MQPPPQQGQGAGSDAHQQQQHQQQPVHNPDSYQLESLSHLFVQ
jgi:hypothetical protein